MRRGHTIAAGVLGFVLLAGCERELTAEEQAAQDERDIAQVEKANDSKGPLQPVTPEPILYPDIERHDLFGASCNYAPGTSLGTRVVAREADAFMKIDGEIVRFAADPGSRELPQHTRSLYSARAYSLRLQLDGEGEPSNEGTTDYEGSVVVFDAHGRVVYEGTGIAQCRG